jgi:hypothetical protein
LLTGQRRLSSRAGEKNCQDGKGRKKMHSPESPRYRCALEGLESRTLLSGAVLNGQDNDLAYDAANHTTWAVYYDTAAQSLKAKSRVDGADWSAETALDYPGMPGQTTSSQVGRYPSIAVSPNGTVGVAYYDADQGDLKYVERNPSTGWGAPQTLESQYTVGLYASLAFSSRNAPFISYWRNAGSSDDSLKVRYRDGTTWVALGAVDSGLGVGRYSSLAIRPNVGWATSYVTNTEFRYMEQATNTAGHTAAATVDTGTGGSYTSLAFDNSNNPWFSYYYSNDNTATRKVRIAKKIGTAAWNLAAVFNGRGYNTNLWFEPNSADARVVFYDDASNTGGNNARRFNYTGGAWQAQTDPTTYLFNGGGSEISAVRGAGGAVTFTSVSNVQTSTAPAYQKVLQVRDQADAGIGKLWPAVTQSSASPAPVGSNPAVAFNGNLWIVGQDITNQSRDDAWYSSDNGVTWTNATAALTGGAAFGARTDYQLTVFNGELWLTGGRHNTAYYADVWHSADGVTWTQAAAAPFPSRAYHGAVVNNGRLYVIGGYNSTDNRLNDVWSTADGATWQQEVAVGTTFTARQSFTTLSYAGRIWVIGGTVGGLSPVSNEVWSSADGSNWLQANSGGNSNAPMRTFAAGVVFDNRMWVLGGDDSSYNATNQVYYSIDGVNWVQSATLPDARAEAAGVVFNNKIWLVGGWVPVRGTNNEVLYSNP